MLTPKMKALWNKAKSDDNFKMDYNAQADDTFPAGMFISEAVKYTAAAMYSGWLLANMGHEDYRKMYVEL